MRKIYLDHAATTPLDKRVFEAMKPFFSKKFGNASSLHSFGREAREALEESREKVAKLINAEPNEIYFTSSGTESDNLAIKGIAYANKKKKHIVTSAIEHHAVLHTCQELEKEGFKVSYVPVDKEGILKLDELEKAVSKETALVSVMHANNEIGTIQPIEEIAKIAQENGVYFHTDAVQTAGKLKIDVEKIGLTALAVSAHKFYGPKGVGFLYLKQDTNIKPQIVGGGHEKGLRSGTENVAGIVGLATALELAVKEMDKENEKELKLREKLINGCLEIEKCFLNGSRKKRLAGNVNVRFSFIEGESLVLSLDDKGIAASTGSACSSKSLEPSHVLKALGLKHVDIHGSLRMTLGRGNTEKEIDYVLEVLPPIVERLRSISPLKRKG